MRRVRLAPAQHILTVVAPRLPKVLLPILFNQLREVQPHHAVALLSRAGHLKHHGIIRNSWNVSEKFMK